MSLKEQLQEDVLLQELEDFENQIVLYNDEINTFDHVIEMLIHTCEHSAEQAEQCAIIVHFKGKCTVKSGSYDDLEPRCSRLLEAGLSAEII